MTTLFSRPGVTVDAEDATLQVVGDVDVTLAADLAASGVTWLKQAELKKPAVLPSACCLNGCARVGSVKSRFRLSAFQPLYADLPH